jgi:hypothetical protein
MADLTRYTLVQLTLADLVGRVFSVKGYAPAGAGDSLDAVEGLH